MERNGKINNDENMKAGITLFIIFTVTLLFIVISKIYRYNPKSAAGLFALCISIMWVCIGGYSYVIGERENRKKEYNKWCDFQDKSIIFIEEAKKKYDETVIRLGKPECCMDTSYGYVWATDEKIITIKKWEVIQKEMERFGGQYTEAICNGVSGSSVNFECCIQGESSMPKFKTDDVKGSFTKGKEYIEKPTDTPKDEGIKEKGKGKVIYKVVME